MKNSEDVLIPGYVNLVYLSDSACDFCTKEIDKLHILYTALSRTNIDVKLIVSGSTNQPIEYEEFKTGDNMLWEMFGKSTGHALIFDRCGRFTYEIIRPWSSNSILLKAAITATYCDSPCGEVCPKIEHQLKTNQVQTSGIENSLRSNIPVYPKLVAGQKISNKLLYKEGKVPLKVVIRLPHTHEGKNKIFEHIEMMSDNKLYHGHIEEEDEEESGEIEDEYGYYLARDDRIDVLSQNYRGSKTRLHENRDILTDKSEDEEATNSNKIQRVKKSEGSRNESHRNANETNREMEFFFKELEELFHMQDPEDYEEGKQQFDYANQPDDYAEDEDIGSNETEIINKLFLHYSKLVNRILIGSC
ncbi:hypothetical protein AAG570_004413 [Ranatra chinensis]|uniref:Selenoprotein P N-terminal domain-containing protein n=1 Tax=Ranatra chinensis TaxID=642074 RepID=A0ABD0Y354_9HEMI